MSKEDGNHDCEYSLRGVVKISVSDKNKFDVLCEAQNLGLAMSDGGPVGGL